MSRYTYECRQDGLGACAQWSRLSVTTKAPMQQHELSMYAEQYALSRQCNPDTVSICCIDEVRNVVDVVLSSVIVNKG